MKNLSGKTVIDFVQRNFEVHGEFEGIVYRIKRMARRNIIPMTRYPIISGLRW